jgi:hypothetical protein
MAYLYETIQDLFKQSEEKGFKKGNIFKDVHNKNEFEIDEILYHHDSKELRNTTGGCIYFNGIWAEITSYKNEQIGNLEPLETPKHYDNSKGTLYKVANERGWNSYLFDIVKRLERAEKKGEFKTDLEKSINVIKLWLKENGN